MLSNNIDLLSHKEMEACLDSLELYLQNTIDLCVKIEALNKQALSLLRKNPKKCKQLAEEAELLSTDNNLPRGKAFAIHLVSLYHLSTGNLRLAVLKSNEALEIFTELNEEQGMSSTLNTLGISYRNSGNYDRGLDCFMKSLDIKTRLGDKKNIMKLLISKLTEYKLLGHILHIIPPSLYGN